MDEFDDGGDGGGGGGDDYSFDVGDGGSDGTFTDNGDGTFTDDSGDVVDQEGNALDSSPDTGVDSSFTDNGDGTFTDADGNLVDQEGNALTQNADGSYTYDDPGQAAAAMANGTAPQNVSVNGGSGGKEKGGGGASSQKPPPAATQPKQPAPAKKIPIQNRNVGDYLGPIYQTGERGITDPASLQNGTSNNIYRRASPNGSATPIVAPIPPAILYGGMFIIAMVALRR